ncbi:MAG: carboxypeptidase regulatory-like domain-containing protein [Terracidiphilus sp.]|nr:carboxypeptidase regulatory-like domain-containing protein [Terracidiphilus sp.]
MTNTFFKLFRSAVPLATLAAVCFLLGGLTAWAQTAGTASVSGTVTDQTGAIVSNASITLTNTERGTSRTSVTDQTGLYSIPNVPVGPYSLKVTANGFQTSIRKGVLEVGNSLTLNVQLTVGAAAAEQIEVIATGAAVETETSTFKQVIDSARITEMPLNGRQATQLVLISGGAVAAPSNDMVGSKNYASSVVINVAGGQGNYNNYMLDGGTYTDVFTNVNLPYPFPDALREFSVESNSLPARNGLHPGALVNGVTVSGTNQFHGTVFEFIRNNIVNANSFFSGLDTLHRNQFGGTFGGAIKHDKLFFFGGYQGTRERKLGSSTHVCLPTAAELAGDFSQMGGNCKVNATTIIDPVSGLNISSTRKLTSTSEINQQALNLIKMLPTGTSDSYGYTAVALPANYNENQYIGRVDYTLNSSQSAYVRYFITNYYAPAFFSPSNLLLTTTAGNDERVQSATAGHVWTINQHLVNTFTATWDRRRDTRGPTAGGINAASALGVNIYEYVPADLRLSVSSGFSVGCGTCSPGFFNTWTEGYNDDLEWSHGKHEIAFGAELLRIGQNVSAGYLQNGNFNFTGIASGNGKSGEGMIDFLTGTLSTNGTTYAFSQSAAQKNAYRQWIFGVFAQDTIHITNRLTANVGIRWDPNFFQHDLKNRGANFSLDNLKAGTVSTVYPYAPAGAQFYGDTGVSKSFTNNQYAQFSPRLGLTFDPTGKGKTVVRAGAAIMYDSPALYTTQRTAANAPFATEIDLTGNRSFTNPWANNVNPVSGATAWNPYPLASPPTSSSVFPLSAFWVMVPKSSKMPTVYQWTASIQQDLGKGWNFSLNYLGNENAHFWLGQAFNTPVYVAGTSTGVAGSCGSMTTIPAAGVACSTATTASYYARSTLTLLNPKYGNYYSYTSPMIYNGATSSYNGLIAALQHRMSHNYSVLVNYTFSHAIDTGDAPGDVAANTFMVPLNPRLDRAAAGFDIRHIFNATVVASSDFKLPNRALRIAANGWQLAPLIRILSGAPYNVTSGSDISLTGMGNDRPNVVAGTSFTTGKKVTQSATGGNRAFFNSAAFSTSTVAAGSFGNAGRNIVRGPNYYNMDASLSRIFKVYDRVNLNLRLEAFNVFNHPFFNSFTTANPNSSSFGWANATADPRLMQAAVKFNF